MKIFQVTEEDNSFNVGEGIELYYSNDGPRVYLNKKYIPVKLIGENRGNQKKIYNVKVREEGPVLLLEEVSPLKDRNKSNILIFVKTENVIGIICDRSFYRQKILLTDYEKNEQSKKKNYLIRLKSDTPVSLLKSDGSVYELQYELREDKIRVKKIDISML